MVEDDEMAQPSGLVACRRYPRRGAPVDLSTGEAARSLDDPDGFVWMCFQRPSTGDLADVAGILGLPALAVEDAVDGDQRPKIEIYGEMTFLVFEHVRYSPADERIDVDEIAVFVGRGFVVTVEHGASNLVGTIRDDFDSRPELVDLGVWGVVHRLADLAVDHYGETLELISETVDEVESQVFDDAASDHVERIYNLKRQISRFRRAVLPLVRPLDRLVSGAVPGMDPGAMPYFRDVHDHAQHAADTIEAYDRLLIDVLQADLTMTGIRQSEIGMQQNEDMRKISAWAAIAVVPTATAGIYGMNFTNMPELSWRYGYFIVLIVIATICLLLYRMFRSKGWL